ncbi:MAG: M28 family peptidase, partial [Bacteroidales bacterium]|nr:M28 family peptidase [Bacteroidales bacterium]
PGANDNASAVAVLLDLAKYYAKNPAEHSVVFMFVTGEEIGLVGSTFAAENPLVDLSKMKFLFNLDMVGTGSTGVAVINGKKEPEAGKLLQTINEENHWFSKVVLGEESCNSDHCPFVQKGVPAHFLFTYGCEYNEYHTVYDDGVELSFTKHIDFCNLLKEFIKRY